MAKRIPPQIVWPILPAAWLESVSKGLPALARDLVDTITTEIPEYRHDPDGMISTETRRIVNEAVDIFVRLVTRTGSLPSDHDEMFRALGRLEAEAGRSHDTLQAAYRLASRTIMRHLLAWERQFPLSGDTVARLSSAIFAFIDDLAALSAEGYAEGRSGREDSVQRARLLTMLIDRAPSWDQITDQSKRIPWALPEQATVLEIVGLGPWSADALAELATWVIGPRGLAADASGRHLMLAPDPVDPDLVARTLAKVARDSWATIGFRVPLIDVGESYRWAHCAVSMRSRGKLGLDSVIRCDDHVVTLLGDSERVLHTQLIERRLGPLRSMSPAKRVKYGRLLSAWLELGTTRAPVAGVLDKHRQTLRYQVQRLEALFGDALADRNARLELMLALRAVLPAWEAEISGETIPTYEVTVGNRAQPRKSI